MNSLPAWNFYIAFSFDSTGGKLVTRTRESLPREKEFVLATFKRDTDERHSIPLNKNRIFTYPFSHFIAKNMRATRVMTMRYVCIYMSALSLFLERDESRFNKERRW